MFGHAKDSRYSPRNREGHRVIARNRREIRSQRQIRVYSASFASSSTVLEVDTIFAQRAISDASELEPLVEKILADNPDQVESYRGGKEGLLGFFVGQVMKETKGKADPTIVNRLVRKKLSA